MNNPARPSILVTGGAGYIGSHAVLALRDKGWPVVVVDNLSTGFRWAVPEDVPFVEADIGDGSAMDALLSAHNIGAIVHFAGSIIVPESVEQPLKYYKNNTANTRTLLECAVNGGVSHFLFSSTAATYGIPQSVPISEDAPKAPINPYGAGTPPQLLRLALF
jgi:UDP-glucose 4-epimerase